MEVGLSERFYGGVMFWKMDASYKLGGATAWGHYILVHIIPTRWQHYQYIYVNIVDQGISIYNYYVNIVEIVFCGNSKRGLNAWPPRYMVPWEKVRR